MYVLSDKVVAITGAANGIGAALAAEVLKDGAKHVRILDVDVVAGVQLEKKLNKTYGANKAKFVKCDVTKDEFLKAIEDTRQEQSYLDVLINNAGVALEANYEEIRKTVEINLIGLIIGTHKAIEIMDKSKGGRGGAVLNISSTAGLYPSIVPLYTYSATKSAVLMFTEILGKEPLYSDTGVRIIAVCYSCTDTTILENLRSFAGAHDEEMNKMIEAEKKLSAVDAARATIDIYKIGKSTSTWAVKHNPPAFEITEVRTKSHQMIFEALEK